MERPNRSWCLSSSSLISDLESDHLVFWMQGENSRGSGVHDVKVLMLTARWCCFEKLNEAINGPSTPMLSKTFEKRGRRRSRVVPLMPNLRR